MRAVHALLLLVPCAIAANLPTFTYTMADGTRVNAMAVDSAGNTYFTGSTSSSAFPATPGALQTQFVSGTCNTLFTPGGADVFPCTDAFVVKLDPTGATVFATFLGGNGNETAGNAISLDADGNIYVGGTTYPTTRGNPDQFPVTPGAAFSDPAATGAFVAKLNPAGTKLIYSTLLPIFANATAIAMALDTAGNVYLASSQQYPSATHLFPTTPGAFQAAPQPKVSVTGVVAKLNSQGSKLVYATYLSGSLWDIPTGVAVDAAGDAFITGYTGSRDFPVTPGAYQTQFPSPEYSGFVTKLNPDGTGLVYSTFVGYSGDSGPWEVKVDSGGEAYVLGVGASTVNYGGFLSHLSGDGSSLVYSTFIPNATGLDLDAAGNAFVAGIAGPGFPTEPGAFQTDFAGGPLDGFVVKYTPDGQLAAATYLGGSQDDRATRIAVAPNGSVAIAGTTLSPDFPGIAGVGIAPTAFVTSVFPALTVFNAGSYAAGAVAPGEIVAIRGYGIGPAVGILSSANEGGIVSSDLGGVHVYFDETSAPLLYVQANQINAQVPWELAGRASTLMRVEYNGTRIGSVPVAVQPALPGVFYVNNSDGTRNSDSNPAKPGDFVTVYGTGAGVTTSPGTTGGFWSATSLAMLANRVVAAINGVDAEVLYAGSAPTLLSGVFQINVRLPADTNGSSLLLTIGSVHVSVPVAISAVPLFTTH